jgi:hypothetical protein
VTVYKITAVVDHPDSQETTFSTDWRPPPRCTRRPTLDLPDQGLGYDPRRRVR